MNYGGSTGGVVGQGYASDRFGGHGAHCFKVVRVTSIKGGACGLLLSHSVVLGSL